MISARHGLATTPGNNFSREVDVGGLDGDLGGGDRLRPKIKKKCHYFSHDGLSNKEHKKGPQRSHIWVTKIQGKRGGTGQIMTIWEKIRCRIHWNDNLI